MGMSLTAITAIQMLALAWVQTRFGVISEQHGAGRREEAGTAWRKIAIVSTAVLVTGIAILACVIAALPWLEVWLPRWGFKERDLDGRFITPVQCLILGFGCIANHLLALQSFYVLARKAKPLVLASVTGLACTGLVVWILGYLYGSEGIVFGYAAAMSFVTLPLHTIAYQKFRRNPVS